MTVHRFVASFPYFTGLPEDVVVNTWHFQWAVGGPSEGDFGNARDNLAQFYSSIYHNTSGLTHAPWLRPLINTLTVYDLADAKPRPPVYEGAMALVLGTPIASSTTAPEVAVCLSYQADGAAGVPQARRRGRVFLGGLGSIGGAGSASTFPSVSPANRTTICNAAAALGNAMGADSWLWVVHSETSAGDSPVTNGWVDDEPDTQRRRGREPAARTTFAF